MPQEATKEQLELENAQLRAKLAEKQKAKGISIKVSPKGAVQVNGLGRFPTTLYATQFTTLLEHKDEILSFIQTNKAQLSYKGE